MQVTKHKVTIIDYTLKDNDGKTLDKSSDGNFAYIHGTNSIIPGLENALEGKEPGDDLSVRIEPKDAYGERDLANIQKVPRDMFPADIDIKPDMQFQAQTQDGKPLFVKVTAVEGDEIVVDGNHPLAGVDLNFDITIVDVRDASEEEIEHGHVHNPADEDH
ncbi:MAG TPA: peptidylprolyl isomerase [Gammaproteobacteria bacterium]|nr:peptidylprolyl isomerase [Gammaproteobacteria bacterium]